jgi:hypothetical protein
MVTADFAVFEDEAVDLVAVVFLVLGIFDLLNNAAAVEKTE